MPITSAGRDMKLARNPSNGLYDLVLADDGNPERTDTGEHAVLTQLLEFRASPGRPGSILDEEGRHGSLLHTVTEDRPETADEMRAYALDALRTLTDNPHPDDVHLLAADANAKREAPGRYRLDVTWTSPDGEKQEQRVELRY